MLNANLHKLYRSGGRNDVRKLKNANLCECASKCCSYDGIKIQTPDTSSFRLNLSWKMILRCFFFLPKFGVTTKTNFFFFKLENSPTLAA